MNELNSTLENMGSLQLVLALLFLGAYAMVLGGFVEGSAQAAAGAMAMLSAAAFIALTTPWVHGVLLTAFVVVGMGLFIATAWVVTTLAGRAGGAGALNSQFFAAYPTQMLVEDEIQAQAEAQAHALSHAKPHDTPEITSPLAHTGTGTQVASRGFF